MGSNQNMYMYKDKKKILQGMVVAILFCLINNEVIVEVKKFFGQHIDSGLNGPQSMAMTQYTVLIA